MNIRTNSKKIGLGIACLAAAGIGWAVFVSRTAVKPDTLVLYGNVDIRDVNLGFRVGGRLAHLEVDEGDAVRTGDVLGHLDPEPYDRLRVEGEANVDSSRAKLALLEAGYRKEEIAQARATVDERRVTLTNVDRILARQTQLKGSGASAEKTYDDAVAARDESVARLKLAEESLQVFESGYRKEDIAQARAELARSEAVLAGVNLRREDTVLRAPSDGVILTRAVEPGSILGEGTTVFALSLTEPIWVRAYVSEVDLGKIHPGSAVQIFTDTSPDQPLKGHVGFISPTAEFTPRSVETPDLRTGLVYRLRIIVDEHGSGLRQGMPVTAKLTPDRVTVAQR